jgi:hypothetical protein
VQRAVFLFIVVIVARVSAFAAPAHSEQIISLPSRAPTIALITGLNASIESLSPFTEFLSEHHYNVVPITISPFVRFSSTLPSSFFSGTCGHENSEFSLAGIVAVSAGGLALVERVISSKESCKKLPPIVLLAPPFFLKPVPRLAVWISPLLEIIGLSSFPIPSLAPKVNREMQRLSVIHYRRLHEVQRSIGEGDLINFPREGLALFAEGDEIVSAVLGERFLMGIPGSLWSTLRVHPRPQGHERRYYHAVTDPKAMGAQAWDIITRRTLEWIETHQMR